MPHFSEFEWAILFIVFGGFAFAVRYLEQMADYLHKIERHTDPDRRR
jgi:hypothetical protein